MGGGRRAGRRWHAACAASSFDRLATGPTGFDRACGFAAARSGGRCGLFWNFTFRPAVAAMRYVRAIEIRPNAPAGSVHHANLLVDRMHSSERIEAKAGAGFAGMEISLNRNPSDPPSHFLFWKPGTTPYSEPAGMAWRLDPGNILVLNTHIQPSGKSEEVWPEIALYFTDEKPTRFPLLMEIEKR